MYALAVEEIGYFLDYYKYLHLILMAKAAQVIAVRDNPNISMLQDWPKEPSTQTA
jgi:hypothetical protein